MRKSIIIIVISLFLSPIFVFAQTYDLSDCDAGTISCECIPETTIDSEKIEELDDCDDQCTGAIVINDEITGYSLQCEIDGVITTLDQGSISTVKEALKESYYSDPELSVEIPGLEFTPAIVNGQVAESNYIGEYIQAVYNWLIPAAALLAVVMMMIAGLQWMLARGDSGKIGNAKTRLRNAVVGMVLLLTAYSITYIVDPELLTYDSLKLAYIDPVAYVNESIDFPDSTASSGGDPNIDTDSIPGDMVCGTEYSLYDTAISSVGDVTYRMGGKSSGQQSFPQDDKTCENGPCKDYCPTGQLCLDCSGYANFIRTCAGLPAAGESGGTAGIFDSNSEAITDWDGGTKVNGIELEIGDMVGRPNNHVLIYIGNGKFADSHGSGRAPGEGIGIFDASYPLKTLWANETRYIRRRN